MSTFISWRDIEEQCINLCQVVKKNNWGVRRIVGVGRGGLIPAVIISHILEVSHVNHLEVCSYTDKTAGLVDIWTKPELYDQWDYASSLFVDEIWDTGTTMKTIQKVIGNVKDERPKFSVLYNKGLTNEDHHYLDYSGKNLPPDEWVEFPWET